MKDLDREEIIEVLQDELEGIMEDVAYTYDSNESPEGEELEYKARSGFTPYIDGGYKYSFMSFARNLEGSGIDLPTKVLQDKVDEYSKIADEHAQSEIWQENQDEDFRDKFPTKEDVNYSDLEDFDSDYAEEFDEIVREYRDDESILFSLDAMYYKPENDKGEDGKNTITLSGSVNLEAPYHRRGFLEDFKEITFTFSSLESLEKKLRNELEVIKSWFDGSDYKTSTTDIKIGRLEEGGEIDEYIDIQGWFRNNQTEKRYYSQKDYAYDKLTEYDNIEVIAGYPYNTNLGETLFFGYNDNERNLGTLFFGKWNNGILEYDKDIKLKYAKGGKMASGGEIREGDMYEFRRKDGSKRKYKVSRFAMVEKYGKPSLSSYFVYLDEVGGKSQTGVRATELLSNYRINKLEEGKGIKLEVGKHLGDENRHLYYAKGGETKQKGEKRQFIIDEKYKIWAYTYSEALEQARQMHKEGNIGWLLTSYAKGGKIEVGDKVVIAEPKLAKKAKLINNVGKVEKLSGLKGKDFSVKFQGIGLTEWTKDELSKTYAKGGEVKKKGNEMLVGGLAGILLGIFLNK